MKHLAFLGLLPALDSVIVRSVELVLREIELKRADVADCDAVEGNGDCLRVDIGGWFLNAAKTALVDPASANTGQPNEGLVANNIQNSFDVFEDDDHDGLED